MAAKNALRLSSFIAIRPGGGVEMIALDEVQLARFASQRYVLGVFVFLKM